jgi:hypothetical protein
MQVRALGKRSTIRLRRRLLVTGFNSQCYTVNVSGRGFCAESSGLPAPGAWVDGTISAAGRVFLFSGRVAWTRPGDPGSGAPGRIGVQFRRIAPEFRELLGLPLWD